MVNLENFPVSDSARKMLGSVTQGFYDNSYVAKWLYEVMGREMDDAGIKFSELLQQIFPETATWGILYHEQRYGILFNPALSLEERRANVIRFRDVRAPMNPAKLEQVISDITGAEVQVIEHYAKYTFLVSFVLDESEWGKLDQVKETVCFMKPSHLSFAWGFYWLVHMANHVCVIDTIHRMCFVWWEDIGVDELNPLRLLFPFSLCNKQRAVVKVWHGLKTMGLNYVLWNSVLCRMLFLWDKIAGLNLTYIVILFSFDHQQKDFVRMAVRGKVKSELSIVDFTGVRLLAELFMIHRQSAHTHHSFCVENKLISHVTIITKRRYWQLDGTYNLDGGKLLNAEIKKEDV